MTQGRNHGFSLTEIMVAMVLLGLLVVGVMSTFTTQKKSAVINGQIVDAQLTVRLLGDLLEDDIRHAGLLVPESAAVCAVDRTNAPDTLYLSDASAIDPTDEIQNDLGARIAGGGTNVTTGSQTLTVDRLVVELDSPDPAYDTDGDGIADSDFRVGSAVIVTDAGNPSRGSACGDVTAVSVASSQISISIETSALGAMPASPEPVDLVAIPAHVYRVDNTLRLVRNGTVIAADVEDLQIAVFIDADEDRAVDAGEYRGDGAGADFDPSAVDISLAREIRTNLVIRTRREDLDNSSGRFQDSENRNAVGVNDGFRRRVYSATVGLRNVGARASTT